YGSVAVVAFPKIRTRHKGQGEKRKRQVPFPVEQALAAGRSFRLRNFRTRGGRRGGPQRRILTARSGARARGARSVDLAPRGPSGRSLLVDELGQPLKHVRVGVGQHPVSQV